MIKVALGILFSAAAFGLGATAHAADYSQPALIHRAAPAESPGGAYPGCRAIWRCDPNGCAWRSVCPRVCPNGYSCFPLYGAYGPYGGIGYWGAYTYSGWGN
jgi:hypothetical protein